MVTLHSLDLLHVFPTHSVVICPESTFEHLWMWFSTLYIYILNSSLNLNYTHRATEVLRQYIGI